jgi:hypothetical protein
MRLFGSRRLGRAVLAVSLFAVVPIGSACSGSPRPRDVAGDRRPRRAEDASADADAAASVPEAPPAVVQPVTTGKKPRLLARATSRALAIDAANVYFGNSDEDGIYSVPKKGGEPTRLARRAPVAGAIALDAESITWIASPGDAVLKLALRDGGQPSTLRDRGIFSDVATAGGDVFITEAIGAGGALLRVTGPTAARLVSFDGAPRAVMADSTHAYVVTPTKIFRTTHVKGELETIATGNAFANPQMDDAFVYVVAEVDRLRVVARVPKAGGPMTTLARDVRDAPNDVEGADVLFIDATRSVIRSVPKPGGEPRDVLDDESVAGVTAIVSDPAAIYLATGARETGVILAVDRR